MALALLLVLGGGVALWWNSRPSEAPAPAPVADAAKPIGETEPNDAPEHAQPISHFPVEVSGTLSAGDRDVYRFTITDPGGFLLDAWIEGPTQARLRATREDGTELASVDPPARIGALGFVRGSYLLQVLPKDPSTVGAYLLKARLSPWVRGLDWEPDDDPEHAQGLETIDHDAKELSRGRAFGTWSKPGDVDCYKVPLSVPAAGADLRVELTPPAGMKPRIVVYDSGDLKNKLDPRPIADQTAAAVGAHVIVPALGERSWEPNYSVCVSAPAGENFAGRYALEVSSYTPTGPFEFEPNDERAAASALPRDITVSGYLTQGDTDWFRISTGPKKRIQATLTPPPDVTASVALLDADGHELNRTVGVPGKPIVVSHAQPTFLQIHALSGANTKQTYDIIARSVD